MASRRAGEGLPEVDVSEQPTLSIVAPFYKAADCVEAFVAQVNAAVQGMGLSYEIVLIEDGSDDAGATWTQLQRVGSSDPHVRVAQLSRNFGQQAAMLAALSLSRGEFVVMMDCDLEHDPRFIPQLYAACIEGGHDLVYARQDQRQHGALKNFNARVFYKLLSLISPHEMDPRMQNYTLLRRPVVEAYLASTRFGAAYLQTLDWLGFKSTIVEVRNQKRFAGKTSYSFTKNLVHALNITVAYSDRLLLVSAFAGATFSVMALLGIAWIFFKHFAYGTAVVGWSSIMVTVMFMGGLILGALGVLGLYLGRVFDQTKQRPRFVIRERQGFDPPPQA